MKRILESCTILLLGLAATRTIASAQETPGLEGVWFAHVQPIDCTSRLPLPNAPSFRLLFMFGHDGSLTTEAATFPLPSPLRSGAIGHWQHTQANMYTGTFWFFRYQETGPGFVVLGVLREVNVNITLVDGDHFTTVDTNQDYDSEGNPIPGASGCALETATRLQ